MNARGEPGLAHALAHEIPSADSIDLVCAFVRWHGLRLLADPLEALCRAGRPLRVITTVFTGSTERKALDWLVARGAQVKGDRPISCVWKLQRPMPADFFPQAKVASG